MLRDTLVGLIEPMLGSARAYPSRAGCTLSLTKHRTIDPQCLEKSPPRRGGIFTNGERLFSISR